MKSKTLRIIPLGGVGEVGKNMTVYEYGNDILIVDAGMMFPDNDMIGIDYIIPDFEYLKDKGNRVRGIFITHGHEDHTGAIAHVLNEINAPIFATPLTKGLIEGKLARRGFHGKADLRTVHAGDSIQLGPFKVDLFHVCHSIPDGVGLGIETPAGLVVHTGDYKFDHTPVDDWPTDYAKLAEFARRGTLALLADSTNSERPGWTPSERVIDPAFDKVFQNAKGRIIVATFASLISRMQQVVNAATRHNRKVAFVGMSMTENVKIAQNLGYLDFDPDIVIPVDNALNMKDNKVVLMVTGSQGEPSSILGRLATGNNKRFEIKKGDTVVLSSHPIPGNEEMVYRVVNKLLQQEADVIYEAVAPIHVSGHASQEEMKLMLHLVSPKYLIPIHGELRMLKQHAKLATEIGIPEENIALVENGQVIEFTDGKMSLGKRIPGGYVFVDGTGVGDVDRSVVREREVLGSNGIVLVNLTLNKNSSKLLDTEIITRGFMLSEDAGTITGMLKEKIARQAGNYNGNIQRDIQNLVKSFIFEETKRRPVVFVTIART